MHEKSRTGKTFHMMHGPLSQPFSEVAPIKMKVTAIIGTSGSFFLNQNSESKQYWKTIMNTYVYIYIHERTPFLEKWNQWDLLTARNGVGTPTINTYHFLYIITWRWWIGGIVFSMNFSPEDVHWPLNIHLFTLPLIHLVVVGFPIFIESLVLWISHAWFWQ